MKEYKSKFALDFSKSVVISFEVTADKNDYSFGVGYAGGKILFRGQNSIDDFENGISISNNKMEFSIYGDTSFVKNLKSFSIGDNDLVSKYKNYIDENGNVVVEESEFFKNEEGFVYYDEDLSIPLDDSVRIYEKTLDYENSKNLIVDGYDVYKQSNIYSLITYIGECSDENQDYILKIEDINDNLTLLSFDNSVTRNLEENNLSESYQEIISPNENGETVILNSSLSDGSLFEKDLNRIRFVFSNRGRLLTVSIYNPNKGLYEKYAEFSFIKEMNEDYLKIYHNSSSSISNVSTNF